MLEAIPKLRLRLPPSQAIKSSLTDYYIVSAESALAKDNKALPLGPAPRPTPRVPSIYEWQLQNAGKN